MKEVIKFLENESATLRLGKLLAALTPKNFIIYLFGELGAGKTTLVRGFLRALGHKGAVKSPTYTLVEPYEINGRTIYHFDLYRLLGSEELENIGIRDYATESTCLIEWPLKGEGYLPVADLCCYLESKELSSNGENNSHYSERRIIKLHARSDRGIALLGKLK